MTKEKLNQMYNEAENPEVITLYIHMPDDGIEQITNFNVKGKIDYVNKVYDENLVHASNSEIYIVDAIITDREKHFALPFGMAIEMAKMGFKIARSGWNGKNQYVELATGISYKNALGEIVNCEHEAIGNCALAFVGTSGVQLGWLASQADMLANDWYVLKQEG